EKVGATSHLVVAVSKDAVMAQLVVQPRQSMGHVAFSPGRIDPIDHGSAGVAILASRSDLEHRSAEVEKAQRDGFAMSKGAIIPNVVGVSVAIRTPEGIPESAIGVSLVTDENYDVAITEVIRAARVIEERLWRH